jgi:hypothetical protein
LLGKPDGSILFVFFLFFSGVMLGEGRVHLSSAVFIAAYQWSYIIWDHATIWAGYGTAEHFPGGGIHNQQGVYFAAYDATVLFNSI